MAEPLDSASLGSGTTIGSGSATAVKGVSVCVASSSTGRRAVAASEACSGSEAAGILADIPAGVLQDFSRRLGEQVRVDEAVERSVEDGLRVPDLVVGAVVLYELVRVEHVRADLTSEADVLRGSPLPRQLRLALLLLELGEPGAEDAERGLLVRGLRALVLALDDDAGRDVRDADGTVRFVHVLAPRPARAIGVDAEVGLVDLHLALVGEQRRDHNLGEGGVPTVRRVERREPDEAVDAALRLHDAVGVLTAHGQSR